MAARMELEMSKGSKGTKSTQVKQDDQAMDKQVQVVMHKVDALISRRQAWQDNEFKRATEALYDMLAACLDLFYTEFKDASSDQQRGKLRAQLISKLAQQKITVRARTPALVMLIRLVFASDGQRARRYATVLAEAAKNAITAQQLPEWISAGGGIEEIRRKVKLTQETLDKQRRILAAVARIKQQLDSTEVKPLATVTLADVEDGQYVLMLGKPGPAGRTQIVGVLKDPSDALRESMIQQMAKCQLNTDEHIMQSALERESMGFAERAANDQQSKLVA